MYYSLIDRSYREIAAVFFFHFFRADLREVAADERQDKQFIGAKASK